MMLGNFTECCHKKLNSVTDVIYKIVRDLGFTSVCFRGHKRFTVHVGGRRSHARGGEGDVSRKERQAREVRKQDFGNLLCINIDGG